MKRIISLAVACCVALVPSAVYAQPKAGKAVSALIKRPNTRFLGPLKNRLPAVQNIRYNLRLDNSRHSAYPSQALSFVASSKAPKRTVLDIDLSKYTQNTNLHITAPEREQWQELREHLFVLSRRGIEPSVQKIPVYLRHSVPEETLNYLENKYTDLVTQIEKANAYIRPKVIYASLPGEGRKPIPQEIEIINRDVSNILYQIKLLRTSLPEDPYLEIQQEYWEAVFGEFNPLIKGFVVKTGQLPRPDSRKLDSKEFNLYNPDGTDYLLPRSETLIRDPDEIEELDSYAYVRMRQNNPPITQEAAAQEREKLLDKLPSGLRIAFINDDTLPRINFEGWAKKGYLGRNATLKAFKDGASFLAELKKGVQYDLVITDLLVPSGGLSMMPQLRSMDKYITVIASSKYDRGEEDETMLFQAGIDGYLWYNTNLNEGAYGYIEYLRAMSNYYHYKKVHKWAR